MALDLKNLKMTKSKKKTVLIACSVAAAVGLAIIIALNVVMAEFGLIIHTFLSNDTVDSSAAGSTGDGNKSVYQIADEVVQEAAADSMVLLENDNYLPLPDIDKVNLFGWNSTANGFLLTGGGSGGRNIITSDSTPNAIKVDFPDALKEEGILYNETLYNKYVAFSNFDADYRDGGSTGKSSLDSLKNPAAGHDILSAATMDQAYEYSHVALTVFSRWGAENGSSSELKSVGSYSNGTFLELTAEEKALMNALEAKGFEVIVLLNTTNYIEPGFLKEYNCVKAAIYVGIPGQSGVKAIPRILKGEISPSGKLNDTLPYDFNTSTVNAKYTDPAYYNATKSGESIVYQEGIYFGYKWYETADAEGYFDDAMRTIGGENKEGYDAIVAYPFGYGLSYSTFNWTVNWFGESRLTKDGKYTVTVNVHNNGPMPAKDVVQLYGHVDYIEGGVERSEIVLLDFAKTELIPVGESRPVTLAFTSYDLAAYDMSGEGGYKIEGGTNNVEISVRTDSHSVVNSKKMSADDINYDYDPDYDNSTTVVNRFTGSNAYAGVPIDGSTAYTGGVNYLSRAGDFANYVDLKQYGAASSTAVNKGTGYLYDGYDDKTEEVEAFEYGADNGLSLVGISAGNDEDGNPLKDEDDNYVMSDASLTLAMLSGDDTSVRLVPNLDLMEELCDYDSDTWTTLLNQLTKPEIKDLIGQGGFQTMAALSIGKPRATDKDGPAGFNNNVGSPNSPCDYTLFPAETLLGCSWSKETAKKVGDAQGLIGSTLGIQGWYGPGVNLHRSVYNTRNYEYYSEDAVLSGKLAAETIVAAKNRGVYCYLKHMAVSEEGDNPRNINTWLTEQTFREVYLKPFEIAVKANDGDGTNGIMTAFNRIGPVLSVYNHAMLTDILRNEWGFRGSVITDWYTGDGYASDQVRGILGGNDLWLAGSGSKAAVIDLDNSVAQQYAARLAVKNILYTYVKTTIFAGSITVNAQPHSVLVDVLQYGVTALMAVGIAVCAAFIVLALLAKDDDGTVAETADASTEGGEATPAEASVETSSAPDDTGDKGTFFDE